MGVWVHGSMRVKVSRVTVGDSTWCTHIGLKAKQSRCSPPPAASCLLEIASDRANSKGEGQTIVMFVSRLANEKYMTVRVQSSWVS